MELEVNRITIISEAPDGTPESYPVPCDMGAWTARPYPYYARVSKDGSLWLCANPAGAKPTDIPSDGSTVWRKQVSKGEKGDKGDKGDQGDAISSYTFIRYSDDGGQTFTPAEAGKLAEARKIQGVDRNYANQPPAYKNEKVITLYDGFIENQPAEVPFILSARAKYHISAAAKSGEMKSNISPKLENGTTVWSNLLFADGKSTLKADGTEKDGEASFSKKINGRIAAMPGIWLRAFVYLEDGITKDPDSYWYDIQIEYGPLTDYMPAPEDMVAGTTPGKWIGVAVWDKPYPPLEPSAYTWSKVQGPDGKPGKAAEFHRLRAVTEKAVVDSSGKLTASLSYQVEHVTGADIELRDTSPDGMKIRYRGDTGTPADTVMGYGSISTATYVLEDYSHVPHPDNLIVELLGADGSVLDRRTVPVTFSTMAALDINGQLGEITARVQGMAGGGRNLLKGTAFDKLREDCYRLSSGAIIDPANKHGGHNSVDCSLTGVQEDLYKGVFFKAAVEPGKEYTASVWVHGDPATMDRGASLEIVYTDQQGQRQHIAVESVKPALTNTWQRFSKTFTVPSGVSEIECNTYNIRNGGMHIAEPMLTSGNMLSDWQPAPEDAEAYLAEVNLSIGRVDSSVVDMKTGLERAGVHIDGPNKSITLKGNTQMIDSEGKSVALFKDGKITSDHIDADYLEAKHAKFVDSEVSGKVTAKEGKIGPFEIGNNGFFVGDYSKWTQTSMNNRANYMYVNRSSMKLEQWESYAGSLAADLKVGLGRGSDPTLQDDTNCASAMYVYRRMSASYWNNMYFPAAQIISDNVINRNIGIRVVGGLQVHGGVMEKGDYEDLSKANVLDFSFGTTFLLYSPLGSNVRAFYPTLSDVRKQLGIKSTTEPFCMPFRVIARRGSNTFWFSSRKHATTPPASSESGIIVDNNGDEWKGSSHAMASGDTAQFALCFTPETGYYCQLLSFME